MARRDDFEPLPARTRLAAGPIRTGFMRAEREWADIGAAFDRDDPSQAFAALEQRLGEIPAADRPSFRRGVIEALETAFAHGKPLTRDWLSAILAASPDYLRADATSDFARTSSNRERLRALLIRGLEAKSPSERGQLVGSMIADLGDVSLLCALVHSAESDWAGERARAADDAYFGAGAEALRTALFDRVGQLAKSGALWTQAAPSSLLWFWFSRGQEQEVYIFTRRSMREAGPLLAMFVMPVERVGSDSGDRDSIAVRRWSKILDFNGLEKCAVEIILSGAAKADKGKARRFLDAYAHGKSELFK